MNRDMFCILFNDLLEYIGQNKKLVENKGKHSMTYEFLVLIEQRRNLDPSNKK